MHKAKRLCVQRLTRTQLETVLYELAVFVELCAAEYLVAAVYIVVEEYVAYMLHMHAYLVRASCLQVALYERHIAKTLEYTIVRYCVLTYLFCPLSKPNSPKKM